MKKTQQIIKDIKSIKIQGATNVCFATLDVLELFLDEYKKLDLNKFRKVFIFEANKLAKIRPTEPMARNVVKYIINELEGNKIISTEKAILSILQAIKYFRLGIDRMENNIIKNGKTLINKDDKILTHCHSSLVEKILISQKSKKIVVYNTETRPLMQGRITAKKLLEHGIKTTMIVDSASGFFISKHSGDLRMDKVFVGCDAISIDGSAVNKVGSYNIALACKENNIPFYIVGSLLKLDSQDTINIEIRKNNEIWKNPTAKKINIINIAFDYIPHDLISGIVCEFGVIKPNKIDELIQKNYPWVFEQEVKLTK